MHWTALILIVVLGSAAPSLSQTAPGTPTEFRQRAEALVDGLSSDDAQAPRFADEIAEWEVAREDIMPDAWEIPPLPRLVERPPELRYPTGAEIREQTTLTLDLARIVQPGRFDPSSVRGAAELFAGLIGLQVATWGEAHPVTARTYQHYAEFLYDTASNVRDAQPDLGRTLTGNARSFNRRGIQPLLEHLGIGHPTVALSTYRMVAEHVDAQDASSAISYALTAASGARAHGVQRIELAALRSVADFEDDLRGAALLRPLLVRIVELTAAVGGDNAAWQVRLDSVPAFGPAEAMQILRREQAVERLQFVVDQSARVLPDRHVELNKLKQVAGLMLLRMHSPAPALPYLTELATFFSESFGDTDPLALDYRLNRIEALVATGQTVTAAPEIDQILSILRDSEHAGLFLRAAHIKVRLLAFEGRTAAAHALASAVLDGARTQSPTAERARLLSEKVKLDAAMGDDAAMRDGERALREDLERLGDEGYEILLEYAVTAGQFNITDPLQRLETLTDIYVRANRSLGASHMVTRDALKWTSFYMVTMARSAGLSADDARVTEAMALLDRAIGIETESPGTRPWRLGELFATKAILLRELGDHKQALDLLRRSEVVTAGYADRIMAGLGVFTAQQTRNFAQEAWASTAFRWDLAQSAASDAAAAHALRDEAFLQVQKASTAASVAIARATARGSSDDPGLVRLARALEEATRERTALEGQLGTAERRADLTTRIEEIRARLEAGHPAFFNLAMPRPVSIPALQEPGDPAPMLRPNEALVLLIPGHEQEPGYVWAVSRNDAAWARLPQSQPDIDDRIATIHGMMDVTRVRGAFTLEPEGDRDEERLRAGFDRQMAHGLYRDLFGDPDIRRVLAEKPHWIVVPRGSFLGLPLSALVEAPPAGADDDPAALRATRWLGLDRTLVLAPSIASVRQARRTAPRARAEGRRFLGLGDPAFAGGPRPDRTAIGTDTRLSRDGVGVVDAVRALPRLPGTRREIERIAGILQADASDMLMGDRANETELARLDASGDLARVRIAVFATHGLIAGALNGLGEPALALSPPRDGPRRVDNVPWSPEDGADGLWIDDGLLKASEAAAMSLDADWVILSACDTASAAGPDAEGLSGLAQAFFYAGARSLLVSQWPVDDSVTAQLTTDAVARTEAATVSRAEAFRAAMQAIAHDRANPAHAHPAFWAPFQLVGVE